MSDTITITGLVATTPRHVTTTEGLNITSFRLASTQRRFDRPQQKWIDGETNWYTVTAFRQLALNSNASIEKGQRVVVAGRLKIRDWENGERTGTTVDIEAEALGHDLSWGTSTFTRSISSSVSKGEPTAEFTTDNEAAPDPTETPEAQPGDIHAAATAAASDGADAGAPEPVAATPF